MKSIDPLAMTLAESLAELAEILAAGLQRCFATECKRRTEGKISRDQLDVDAADPAACGRRAHGPQSKTA